MFENCDEHVVEFYKTVSKKKGLFVKWFVTIDIFFAVLFNSVSCKYLTASKVDN
jgi:hypothetical protein